MIRSQSTMADSDNSELIGFIGSRFEALGDRFETLSDRFEGMREQLGEIKRQMATKEDLARLDGRLSERIDVAVTSIRGDIEQIHLPRFDGTSHDFQR